MYDSTPQILFVNDDPRITKLLRSLFADEQWSCFFVTSAAEAEESLKKEPVDLILADADISGINGCELLTRVRQQYPETIRLFLTGDADCAQSINALTQGVAQQIVPRPWIDQELKEIIRSALRQKSQQKRYSQSFQCLINSIQLLPSIPESYSNIRACVTGDDVNIEKMANYISQDVAISATLLRWANSALFGQRFMVDTVKRAIIVLGTRIVENLVLSESLNRAIIQQLPTINGFDLESFKKHSMATAVLSRLLIKSTWPHDSDLQDRAFVAGLLHDCGKLVLSYYLSDKFEQSIRKSKAAGIPLRDAERAVYSSTHNEIGAFLTEWWALPYFIVNANHWHHDPQAAPSDHDIVTATHVANLLSYQLGYGSSEEKSDREIAPEYVDKFFLNEEAVEILKAETETTIRALTQP
jgi:HD-like signal output (HDOD) protein/CheY-like chemotaxis protein